MAFSDLSLFTDANLKAYYKLEDVSDSKASYTLTNNNTVTFTAAKYNNGANFGSSNTNKSLTTSSDLGITGGAITIVAWFKLLAEISSSSWYLIDQSDAGTDVAYFLHYIYNSGNQLLRVDRTKRGDTNNNVTLNTGALGTTNWYHAALTYNTTNLIGYLNGVAVGSPLATSGNGTGGTAEGFCLGCGRDNSNNLVQYASVLMDDVAIFNRALTAAEIKSIYDDAVGGYFHMSI